MRFTARWRRAVRVPFAAAVLAATLICGCSRPSPAAKGPAGAAGSGEPPAPAPAAPSNAASRPAPARALAIAVPDPAEAQRWLHVVRVREGADGGVATADFDPANNKITIETSGVLEFRMDTDRMSIDWARPVILRIDGYNSQLLPRDESSLIFRVNESGQWSVITRGNR